MLFLELLLVVGLFLRLWLLSFCSIDDLFRVFVVVWEVFFVFSFVSFYVFIWMFFEVVFLGCLVLFWLMFESILFVVVMRLLFCELKGILCNLMF